SDREGNTVWRPLHTGLFGVIRREESRLSPYAARQNLRFAGQYYDEETGLHYNTLRYYDPGSGSFTQPDPIGLAGGINLYAYGPNPLGWIDPLGLTCGTTKGKFKRANDALIKRLNTDAAFRRDMFNRHPELSNWMKNGSKSSSPAGFTWHHHEDLDRLFLVDRLDHKSNHALYHPTGNGGRDIWGGGDPGRKGKLDGATGKAC
ncbi:RHS repeat-associated core domain-containing protein, partial [Erwinia sorbitola]